MNFQHRNNIRIVGADDSKPMMVLAHGFGCDQSMWRYLEPAFSDNFQLLLFDLVGSGGSDLAAYSREKYGSLHGYADDLVDIVSGASTRPVVFVGHSVSAMIGLLASNKAPQLFQSQIMVGPSACYINDDNYQGGFSRADIADLLDTMEGNYLGWSSTMAPAIMGAADRPQLGEELTNSFCRTDPEIAKHFARVTFLSDHRGDLAHSHMPTLILQCSDDLIAPVAVGEFIQRSIAGSVMTMIENTGHCPHLSAPDASVNAIRDFLRHAPQG